MFASITIVAGVYLYLAVLFSFVYVGMSRLEGVQLHWVTALVTSVFIPFQCGDLPNVLGVSLLQRLMVDGFGQRLQLRREVGEERLLVEFGPDGMEPRIRVTTEERHEVHCRRVLDR
jgi:hypothetical protein